MRMTLERLEGFNPGLAGLDLPKIEELENVDENGKVHIAGSGAFLEGIKIYQKSKLMGLEFIQYKHKFDDGSRAFDASTPEPKKDKKNVETKKKKV